MENINLGQYSLPVILSICLGVIFKLWAKFPDRFKSLVAIVIGALLGVAAMYYNQQAPFTVKIWIDYILYGCMAGAASVGLYEVTRSVKNPRA